MKKDQTGFSLIELLIVVVVIGIVAAIAVPNLLAARRASNEAAAISTVRTLSNAQQTYFSTKGGNNNYASLAQLRDATMIDGSLALADSAGAAKSGYYYTLTLFGAENSSPPNYVISSNPAQPPGSGVTASGMRRFCAHGDGIVRNDEQATSAVATIQSCLTLTPIN